MEQLSGKDGGKVNLEVNSKIIAKVCTTFTERLHGRLVFNIEIVLDLTWSTNVSLAGKEHAVRGWHHIECGNVVIPAQRHHSSAHDHYFVTYVYVVTSHPRPSRFSACNIEKVGVAWGRGYHFHTCTSKLHMRRFFGNFF